MSTEELKQAGIAHNWWQELAGNPDAEDPRHQCKGDTGALARLRRATSPVEALAEARAIDLAKRLHASPDNPHRLAVIGALAGVLAHVRNHDDKRRMARLLGPSKKDENGPMSPLRFRRLLAAETPQDLMRQMRNAVKLLRGTTNVLDLASAMLHWNDTTRIRWTYEYWNAGNASPDATASTLNAQHEEITQ